MTNMLPNPTPPPQVIYLIRHAEKPTSIDHVAYNGVDVTGTGDSSCLIPQGWQRAGGLATLFDSAVGTMRPDLSQPDQIYAPCYSDSTDTINHRTYETILPLSLRLGLTINTSYGEGDEKPLAEWIVAQDAGVSLVCWEHTHIPAIATNLPLAAGVVPPTTWPDDRFDLIWRFTLSATDAPSYTFAALPEMLLAGDGPA